MLDKIVFVMLFQFSACCVIFGQNYTDSLTIELQELVDKSEIPGFGVSIVTMDEVLFAKGFGYSNVEEKSDYNSQTIQNIGSITKMTIAVSLMQLVEQGMLKLEDDINKHLPFKITNPNHPNEIITIRQLATHTSSLTDGPDDMTLEKTYLFSEAIDFKKDQLPDGYFEYFEIYKTNQKMSLNKFLHNTFCPHGEWYHESNFLATTPGTTYQYSNLGTALLALIIEEISDQTFAHYTKEHIFDKLEMENTHWKLKEISSKQLASVYMSNGQLIPNYESITYPDGGLYTSVTDFSKFLQDMIKGINGNGQLLKPESYKLMMSNQLVEPYFPKTEFKKSKGLLWDVNKDGDNISANGSDPGIDTYLLFTTAGNIGILMFKNSNSYGNEQMEKDFFKIRGILFKYVSKLIAEK